MKRKWKQIGSLFMALCMVITMLPMTAFAERDEADSGTSLNVSGTITAFAEMDEEVSRQTVEIGTPEEELNLPDELAVTVTTISVIASDESDNETATDSEASEPETWEETKETTVQVSDWTADPVYDENATGEYVFTPALDLPEGLTVSEDVSAPQIIVNTIPALEAKLFLRGAGALSGDETTLDVSQLSGDVNGSMWEYDSDNQILTVIGGDGSNTFTLTGTGGFKQIVAPGNVNLLFDSNADITVNSNNLEAAISTQGDITFYGCTVNATSFLGCIKAASVNVEGSTTSLNVESKGAAGIIATGDITFSGGTVTVKSGNIGVSAIYTDLNSGGDITITGGNITAKTPGPGSGFSIHADGQLTISGGTVYAPQKLHAESTRTISGGSINSDSDVSPQNSGKVLALAELTGLPANEPVTEITAPAGYGINDVVTDDGGNLYFWLPIDTLAEIALTVEGREYTGGVTPVEDVRTPVAMVTTTAPTITVTTYLELKAALEGNDSEIIVVGDNFEVTDAIYMGADHELRVPSGKVLSFTYLNYKSGRILFGTKDTPADYTLTINGGGTLEFGMGTYRIGSVRALHHEEPVSYGTVNLSDIRVENSGNGFCVRNLNINDGAKITGEGDLVGTTIAIDRNRTCTVNTGGEVEIKNHGTSGILLEGTLHINGGTVTLEQGKKVNDTSNLEPAIDAVPGSTLKITSGTLKGMSGGYIYLYEGAKVQSVSGKFRDWGHAFTASNEVTVGPYGTNLSSSGLTKGAYLWEEANNAFAQHGITVSQEPQSTSFTVGAINGTLSVNAAASNSNPVTYQWYVSDTPDSYWLYGAPIPGADTSTYTIPADLTEGTYYYYCSFKASGCLELISDPAAITVYGASIPTYLLTVTGGTGGGSYAENAKITITADAAPAGKVFDKWVLTNGGGTLANASDPTTAYTMPGNAATVTAAYKDVPAGTYTITASAGNGGSISPSGTQTVNGGSSKTFVISPNSNYSIASVTVDGVNQGVISSYTFNNVTANHTISAVFSYSGGGNSGGGSDDNDGNTDGSGGSGNSGGGSGGSSGGSRGTSAPPPSASTPATTPVTATPGTNGTAIAEIPDKAITDAIAKAQSDAKAQGGTSNGTAIALDIAMPDGTNALTATLTSNSLNSLVGSGVTSLVLNGAPVKVAFDLKALQEIQKQSNGTISITMAPNTSLSASAQAIIGSRPVYDLTVSYGSGNTVSGFGGGTVTVSVRYTPDRNESVGSLYAVYVDAAGNASRIAGSAYDANSGSVIFTTTHFSLYGIGYTAPRAQFTDTATHWGKEAIDYVVGRGLLSGISATTFEPNTAITRGMLATALGRMSDVDVTVYTGNSFTDVKTDREYRPYIEWAYKEGIMQGAGNQQFAPDRAITREEAAAIFENYAKATGYKLPVTREAAVYADASSIGSTCQTAVKAMQQAGIVMGGSGNAFNPKSNATRGEVSSMIHRYVKLTIDPATAQGWAQNDAGQWFYYKGGKTLIGWLDIGGKWYYFTKDGLMASGKWLQIESKWYYFYADGTLAVNTRIDGFEVDENGVRKTN
ncbi:MAG: S-layer homology domain-containing protein [Lacrimispora sp.]|uniref:S-layer homology domain-containing protein n=1 Tax=Lacrimispora sp. TaxID=2719234 RepID=UPI0039E52D51